MRDEIRLYAADKLFRRAGHDLLYRVHTGDEIRGRKLSVGQIENYKIPIKGFV